VAWVFLNSFPISAVIGATAIGAYLVFDRKLPAPFSIHTGLTLLLALWVTYTTFALAVAPYEAQEKWDWAVKTILFSAFIPLVIRSMVQIEAFLQVYIFAVAIHVLPFGAKVMIGGGGYGRELGVVSGNSGFAEGSTLAAVSLLLVPILLYLRRNTVILPPKYTKHMYTAMVVVFIACALGTYARTALIGMIVLGGALWLRTDRKFIGIIIGICVGVGVFFFTSDAWDERISTISEYESESSALGRILVWKWTLGFVAEHWGGGGFNSYIVNVITFPGINGGEDHVSKGKAFHSIYFEVLGEHGIPGILIYGALIVTAFFSLQRSAKLSRGIPEMKRCREMAYALQVSLLTLLACGLFIGIAFQPMIFYVFALAACLGNHVRRSVVQATKSVAMSTAPLGQGASGSVMARGLPVGKGTAAPWRMRQTS
jgi:probable O-glycosylation ligase (exosortase A-associated)